MELRSSYKTLVLSIGALFLMLKPVMAAEVSKADLAKVEKEVEAQNLEHKKLQAQATQISLELTEISKDMIKSAKQIQNSEEKISQMENELETLKTELQKKTDDITKSEIHLPELTIPNLYKEIIRNGILYPKIVLAQAILETGWFRSSVCRNKHNLFGLTNPRTGKYYEFNHWTESVQAYYTKVQYKYKGGNYLLWLDEIGYAEDPRYIICLCNVLKYL